MKPAVLTPALPLALALIMACAGTSALGGDEDEDREAKQAELDRQCELARETKLAPIREEIYQECIGKQGKDPDYCRRYADEYDGTRIGGAPRFYELPECEAAFEYRKAGRR